MFSGLSSDAATTQDHRDGPIQIGNGLHAPDDVVPMLEAKLASLPLVKERYNMEDRLLS
jgi:hypothetical protein